MEEKVFEISAKEVTIEVIDEATGKLYRRTLPIDYYETANSLVLRGENLNGSISDAEIPVRTQEIREETASYIAHTLAVANDYKDIKDVDGVLLLDSEKFNALEGHLDFYDGMKIDLKGTASVYALTWLVTAYVRIADGLNITDELFPIS